jgi:hypothetical protein
MTDDRIREDDVPFLLGCRQHADRNRLAHCNLLCCVCRSSHPTTDALTPGQLIGPALLPRRSSNDDPLTRPSASRKRLGEHSITSLAWSAGIDSPRER